MTIKLPTGVTVHVEFPQMPQVCRAPEAPQPGGVTVPVQGGLTAEQLAHIVATVTAKVVEELGGQPGNVSWEAVQGKPAAFPPEAHRHNAADIDDLPSGGGGAGIDDTTIGTDTTWSSQNIDGKLEGKASANFFFMNEETGEWEDSGASLQEVLYGWAYQLNSAVTFSGDQVNTNIRFVSELPDDPRANQIYAVRNPDTGVITSYMPVVMV